jgi:hypothetical protein
MTDIEFPHTGNRGDRPYILVGKSMARVKFQPKIEGALCSVFEPL